MRRRNKLLVTTVAILALLGVLGVTSVNAVAGMVVAGLVGSRLVTHEN